MNDDTASAPPLLIIDAGPQSLLQDLGRPGLAHLGVSPSGAADRAALRRANRLVGNAEGAAAIETLFGGLTLRSGAHGWVAVDGAAAMIITGPAGPRRVEPGGSGPLHPGDVVTVQPPTSGLRSYLAFRGGIGGPQVLGSRATDVLSGLGPAPLRAGDRLTLDRPTDEVPDTAYAPTSPPPERLLVAPGPRQDWFDTASWRRLLDEPWTILSDSDRVAVRLQGPPLTRTVTHELPSEGVIRGAVQVPASGLPLLFGADHPVTGGYPVIAVLDPASADAAAQLRPGDTVRFGPVRNR